jgi:hypothetical protein
LYSFSALHGLQKHRSSGATKGRPQERGFGTVFCNRNLRDDRNEVKDVVELFGAGDLPNPELRTLPCQQESLPALLMTLGLERKVKV